ncbi:MAG: PAS domain-containing protein [bacterium]
MQESELKNWLRTELFEHVPNTIAIIDREFHIVEANRNFTETFGEWKGKSCYEVYKGSQSPCPSCKAELVFADGKGRISEERRLNKHGKHSYHVVHFEPIVNHDGTIPYVIEMSRDVTERRMLQREHDIVFDRVPCYIAVLDRDMAIVRNNELFRKTFGESIGKKCYEVYRHRSIACENCPAQRTFADGHVHRANKIGRTIGGEAIHYHVTTAPLSRGGSQPSHVIEMALDTTGIRVLEEQLKESFDFQESLIESAIDSIVAADADGEIRIFNPSAEKMFKYRPNEVIGRKSLDRFVPQEFIDVIAEQGSHCVLDETITHDCSKEPIPVRFSGVVLKSGEKYIGSAAFFQDLRKMKQLEHEKLEAERLAAVGQTVAGLAHGIKNVLMGLDGGMYVVNSGMRHDDKELTRQGWEMLQSNIERITAYVKDFLGFAKGHKPVVKSVDPNRMAGEVVDLYKDMADQAGIHLTAELQEGIEKANLDPEGIHTCLANLVSNAIDACEMSDKTDSKVTLKTFERADALIYEVSDNGCGMDYEIKQKVFTTFFSTKESSRGTGLGLLVTRRITQEHGGKVTLESSEGEGSVFRLEFPRNRLPELTEE